MIELTKEQAAVRDFAVDRIRAGERLTTIGGYAGTGKTTIVSSIVQTLRDVKPMRFAFGCYTGKAKEVLERKLVAANALSSVDYCGTLHSLVYSPTIAYIKDTEAKTIEKKVTFDSREQARSGYGCIIVDEASMVDENIFAELQAMEIPILAIGDHGQLPPIHGRFNLMEEPMIKLETILRQAEGNPIIQLSMMARTEGKIREGRYGDGILKTSNASTINRIKDFRDWTFICGTNRRRITLNKYVRAKVMGNHSDPIPGDRVICLQNNHKYQVFNGMLGTIQKIEPELEHWYHASIDMGDTKFNGSISRWQFCKEKTLQKTVPEAPDLHPSQFGDLFDYGYCLTTWKAQGSEWPNVVFYEESTVKNFIKENWNRFLYTAVTRAKNKLLIVAC